MTDPLTWSPTSLLPTRTLPLVEDMRGERGALRPGIRLDEFEIVRVLGVGGFGIVYLALDQVLLRQVAIKEYLPTALAARGRGNAVRPRTAALAETFKLGLESFYNEARMLASFDHPSLVKVHRFWKANGTAYMAMPYYAGKTLKQTRSEMTTTPDGAWLLALVEPLLGALEALHREGVYHRDIAPDNILLQPDGRPVLLDFGSARRVIGDHTQTLTAILKPNFAPVEQYADETAMRQGPWTDLYALGATVHFMLTGTPPTPAVMRAVRDAMPALARQGDEAFPGVHQPFLCAMDWTLALAPDDRPQSVAALRSALEGTTVPPPASKRHPAVLRNGLPEFSGLPLVEEATQVMSSVVESEEVPAPPVDGGTRSPMRYAIKRVRLWATVALALAAATGWLAWASDITPVKVAISPEVPAPPSAAEPPRSVQAPASTPLAVKLPVATTAAAFRQVRPANTPAGSVAASPREICGDLGFFARTTCISRSCQNPHLRDQPQCVEARRIEDQRLRRMEQ